MSEVVAQKVEVIVTAGTPGAVAAKNATGSIPIIAVAMADPVRTGLVTNLARPEGNLTGLSMGYGDQFVGKWLELLREIVPSLSSVAVISNPDNAVFRPLKQDVVAAASKLNLKIQMLDVRTAEAIDDTFKRARKEAQAVLLLGDPLTLTQKRRIAKLAAVHRLPAVYNHRSFVDEGGLMSYAPDTDVQVRRAAEYVDQILKGRKIADLPVEYPTAFKLVVNAQAAKAAGLVLPGSLLSRADETLR
jgi:putative ABC transport system substrate-binding protein